jgi:hypothetical protein
VIHSHCGFQRAGRWRRAGYACTLAGAGAVVGVERWARGVVAGAEALGERMRVAGMMAGEKAGRSAVPESASALQPQSLLGH